MQSLIDLCLSSYFLLPLAALIIMLIVLGVQHEARITRTRVLHTSALTGILVALALSIQLYMTSEVPLRIGMEKIDQQLATF